MRPSEEGLILARLADRGIAFSDTAGVIPVMAELLREERQAIIKEFRTFADEIWADGKTATTAPLEKLLKSICTEIHRRCQAAAGEEPLPAAGARLSEETA